MRLSHDLQFFGLILRTECPTGIDFASGYESILRLRIITCSSNDSFTALRSQRGEVAEHEVMSYGDNFNTQLGRAFHYSEDPRVPIISVVLLGYGKDSGDAHC